jgi:hypothetical protein
VKPPLRVRRRNHEQAETRHDEPSPAEMMPFGRYGGGHWTGHPIGLLIVLGLLLMGLVGLPEVRWFFVVSLALGGVFGLILWRLHRQKLSQEKLRGN